MSKLRNKEEPLKFEDALTELEAIIAKIESGEAGLEQSLAHYERGMKLIGDCRTILAAAEQKIAELSVDSKGKLRLQAPAQELGGTFSEPDKAGGVSDVLESEGGPLKS
jgi:exodeoxyribonuclease VII small subunit